jgi:uncharacterized protein (TIGR02246 family)
MKICSIVFTLLVLSVAPAFAQANAEATTANSASEQKVQNLEQSMWDAWKNHDSKPFEQYLTDDVVNVAGGSVDKGKAAVMKDISSASCQVNSFALSDYNYTWVDDNTVIVTYKATQDATCNGKKVPDSTIASSVWTKKGDKWVNPFHQETP